MAILDTFAIIFNSNAKQAKKGIEEVKTSVKGLKKPLKEVNTVFGNLGQNFLKDLTSISNRIIALVGTSLTLGNAISTAMDTADLYNFSQALNLNVNDVNAWSRAYRRSGGNIEEFRGLIASMSKQLANISITGGGEFTAVLSQIGVNAIDANGKIKPLFQLLPQLADRLKLIASTNRARAFALATQLGLAPKQIRFLEQGSAALARQVKQQKENSAITAEYTEKTIQLQQTFAVFNDTLTTTSQVISNAVIPSISELLSLSTGFLNFLNQHPTGLVNTIIGLSVALGTFALVTSPLLQIAAAVGAVGVAIYELSQYMEGNDSALSRFLDKHSILKGIMDGLVAVLRTFLDLVGTVWGALKGLFNFITGSSEHTADTVNSIVKPATTIADVPQYIEPTTNVQKIRRANQTAAKLPFQASQAIQSANNVPVNSVVNHNNTFDHSATREQSLAIDVGGITINAQGDSSEIARNVGDRLSDELSRVINNIDNGVRA